MHIIKTMMVMSIVVFSSSLEGMHFFKTIEHALSKFARKDTVQEQHSQESSRYKNFGYLVHAQLFNRIHELLKVQQLSDDVINKSYPYYDDPNISSKSNVIIESMPLIASVFFNYGKHYGFQNKNNVPWKVLLKELLLQENIRHDVVVSATDQHGDKHNFSLLFILFFGLDRHVNGKFFCEDKISDRFVCALEVLEVLREHRIKLNSQQGMTRITKDGMWFYSILECLKDSYYQFGTPESSYTQDAKEFFFRAVQCLVDMGVDVDVWHAYEFKTHDRFLFHEFFPGGLYKGQTGLNDIIHPSTRNSYTIRILSDFRDLVKECIALHQSKSLGFLVQHQRQRSLMNVHFGFC